MFSKAFLSKVVKFRDCVGKSSNTKQPNQAESRDRSFLTHHTGRRVMLQYKSNNFPISLQQDRYLPLQKYLCVVISRACDNGKIVHKAWGCSKIENTIF